MGCVGPRVCITSFWGIVLSSVPASGVIVERRAAVRKRASGPWAILGAIALGFALSNLTVFISFLAFNFILHVGS